MKFISGEIYSRIETMLSLINRRWPDALEAQNIHAISWNWFIQNGWVNHQEKCLHEYCIRWQCLYYISCRCEKRFNKFIIILTREWVGVALDLSVTLNDSLKFQYGKQKACVSFQVAYLLIAFCVGNLRGHFCICASECCG